jgi:hypothetical protein
MNTITTPPELWIGAPGTASTIVVIGNPIEPDRPLSTDPEQAYFFTAEWQAYVDRAEEDITEGRVAEFETIEGLFADLDE